MINIIKVLIGYNQYERKLIKKISNIQQNN